MKISKHYIYQLTLPKKPMYLITPNLYIGGERASTNYKYLKANGINVVINCAKELHVMHPKDVLTYNFPFSDSPTFPINLHFDETNKLIDNLLKQNKKILISCQMGINRSMSILCAYLYHSTKNSMDDIIDEIATIRKCCMLTNPSFYRQLKNLNNKYIKRKCN